MIKRGDVAYIKTTGEAVFVLEIYEGEGSLVDVRRPVMGQNGISHSVDSFRLEELETFDQQRKRFLQEREDLFGTKKTPETSELKSFLA